MIKMWLISLWCQVGLGRTRWVNHSCKLDCVNEFSQCLTLLFFSVFLFCPSVLFYQAQTEHPGDSAHSHRWTSLELVKGTYSTDDSPSDIAEIRLDKAVPLKVLWILHMNHAKHKLHFGTNSLPPCCSCRRMWNMLSVCVTMAAAQPMGMEAWPPYNALMELPSPSAPAAWAAMAPTRPEARSLRFSIIGPYYRLFYLPTKFLLFF